MTTVFKGVSIGAILFTVLIWQLMKKNAATQGKRWAIIRWLIFGYLFLFSAAWFACGVGGTPGNLLSPDPANHDPDIATNVAMLSIFLSVQSWACLAIGQWKSLRVT